MFKNYITQYYNSVEWIFVLIAKEKAIINLLCGECDVKLKEQIKKKMRNWNWPFENNILTKQQTRNDN